MTDRLRAVLAAGVVGATALVVAGLPGAAGGGPSQASGGTLRIVTPGVDIDHVDPALAYHGNSWMLELATCSKLYGYPDRPLPAGGRLLPEVAAALPRLSRDGRTATIELRRTFRFHTGAPITAANFAAALNRLANPKMQSPAASYLTEIVGASAVLAGRATSISGVEELGRYTLRIRLREPLGDLAARLSMPFFCPIAATMPVTPDGVDTPLGSGPFYVASRVRGRQIVLERNRFYRGPRKANVARVVVSVGGGVEACRRTVDSNEADYCLAGLTGEVARDFAGRYGVNRPNGRLFFTASPTTFYFAFNHDRRAFKSVAQIPLKQAINWAIDRPALVRAGGYLSSRRSDQILPPQLTRPARLYPLEGVTPKSLAQARALLRKARFKPARLVLYTASLGSFPVRAQIFQFNLRRIGIEVDIRYFSGPTLLERVERRGEPFDVVLNAWGTDYLDAASFFVPLLDGNRLSSTRRNQNVAYFDRPKYNREIARINRLQGNARRRAWAALDEEMMRNDPPWAPFGHLGTAVFVSEDLGCVTFDPVNTRLNIVAACKK